MEKKIKFSVDIKAPNIEKMTYLEIIPLSNMDPRRASKIVGGGRGHVPPLENLIAHFVTGFCEPYLHPNQPIVLIPCLKNPHYCRALERQKLALLVYLLLWYRHPIVVVL
ncbi:hypothetical protein HN51_037781 [Arachis hypogaea]